MDDNTSFFPTPPWQGRFNAWLQRVIYLHVLTISHTPFPLRVLTLPLPHQSLYLCCKIITIILNPNFRNLSEYEIIIL